MAQPVCGDATPPAGRRTLGLHTYASGSACGYGGGLVSTSRDPYPWTWEVPAAIGGGLGLVGLLGTQLGRSAACAVTGAGWLWPEELLRSAGGVLTGDSAAGLAAGSCSASPALLLPAVMATSLLLLLISVATGWQVLLRFRSGAGYASKEEAASLLGVRRLRSSRAVVRPDLFGKGRR